MATEKVTFRNSRGLKLVGVLHIPEQGTKSIVVLAHGFLSGKDGIKIKKAAEEFSKNGFAVLRFDFGGHGESDKTSITIEKQVDDLKSAINFVEEKGYTNIGLLGSSIGGLCSILAYNKKIRTIVLWAPVTKARTPTEIKDKKVQDELMNNGYLIINEEWGEFKIDKEYFIEMQKVNQEEILRRIKIPVLIIHGDKDDDVPIEHSKSAIHYLPKESRLEVIENSDHTFYEHVDKLFSLSLAWFKKYL